MNYNENYKLKKTVFGRTFLANQETGDVIDVNQITIDILEHIKKENLSLEELLEKLSLEYDATKEEIRNDVEEIIEVLKDYNVIY